MPTHRTALFAPMLTAFALGSCRESPTAPSETEPSGRVAAAVAGFWTPKADHPRGVWAAASASLTNPSTLHTLVYVIGGRIRQFGGAGTVTNAVKVYDVGTNSWNSRAPVPVRLSHTNGAVELDGKIYVTGGFTRVWDPQRNVWRLSTLKSLYVYDPATDTWTRRHDMPIATANGVSAGYRGMLYVGTSCYDSSVCGDDSERGALWRYSPATDRWVLLDRTGHDLWQGSGGFIGGKLYLIDFLGAMDIYNVATKGWSTGPKFPARACDGVSTTLQAKLYLLGCQEGSGDYGDHPMVVFDPATGEWSEQADAPVLENENWTLSRVVVGGRPGLELIGGAGTGSNLQFLP